MLNRVSSPLTTETQPAARGSWDSSRTTIDRVVIHTMEGTLNGTIAWFKNDKRANLTSAHYGLSLDGKRIINFVNESCTAYHAGNYPMNQRSIGIEHEDNAKPNDIRPDSLYEASSRLVRDICTFYNIPIDRAHIVKHNEVSNRPTACPAGLDIDRIVSMARQTPVTPISAPQVISSEQTTIPRSTFELLVTKSSNFDTIAAFFELVEAEKSSPSAGTALVERIKQNQRTYLNVIEQDKLQMSQAAQLLSVCNQRLTEANNTISSLNAQISALKCQPPTLPSFINPSISVPGLLKTQNNIDSNKKTVLDRDIFELIASAIKGLIGK